MADSLEYEPEDSLIVDPFLTAILNEEREIQVGEIVYRFINEGMLAYNAADSSFFNDDNIYDLINPDTLSHGQTTNITDSEGNNGNFTKIEYTRNKDIDGDTIVQDRPEPKGSGNDPIGDDEVSYNTDGSITLGSGVIIPHNMIRRATFKKGGGNGSWFAKGISSIFGTNVTITNKYDSRHRMKLRMYEQDYLIYRAIGMTVRMQKRTLGIWWRKKAQEFRYGWTAIECEYKFSKPAFTDPPKLPNGDPEHKKYPIAMDKKFPFSDANIVLFHIPFIDYDAKTGDLNKILANCLKSLSKDIKKLFDDPSYSNLKNNPRGLFSPYDEDKKSL